MYLIIGSGLTGIICAHALLERGARVTLIDAGAQCEPEKLQAVDRLGVQAPEEWDPALVASITSNYLAARSGLAFKQVYGSEFPYAVAELETIRQEGTCCLISHARGGLSNVWGAAVLPNLASDCADWPIPYEQMVTSYAAVSRIVPIAGRSDDLEALFPFFVPPEPAARPSAQARSLLERWERHREPLRAAGFVTGQSRLALRTRTGPSGAECRYVGLCLSGCPYRAIYSAVQTLEGLIACERFRYAPGWIARSVRESAGSVRVQCIRANSAARPRETGGVDGSPTAARAGGGGGGGNGDHGGASDGSETIIFEGQRVFLACGTLATAKLLLQSLGVKDATLPLRYQPYFLLPWLMFEGDPQAHRSPLHTLAQAFIEVRDGTLSRHPVHLQLYTYNSFIRQRVESTLRWLPACIRERGASLWGRLAVIQGYLDSSESDPISLIVGPGDGAHDDAPGPQLRLEGRVPMTTMARVLGVGLKLARHTASLGGIPLLPLLELGHPGKGNHIGGVFPMAKRPGRFQSDTLGRPMGLERIHLVDASVLPSLASTTFSYTAMANAHRIAEAVAKLDAANGACGDQTQDL